MLDVFCCSDLSEPSGSSAGDELVDEIDDDEDDEDVIDLVDEAQPETTGQPAQCLPSDRMLIMLCKALTQDPCACQHMLCLKPLQLH